MPGFVVFGPPLAAAFALALGAWWMARRVAAAETEASAERIRAAARDRSLGLLRQEMQVLGLSLLAHAGGALRPAEAAAATAAEAKRLLDLADELAELLAAEAGPRRLAPEPVRLRPLLEEAVAASQAQLGLGRRQWKLAPDLDGIVLSADARALRGAVQQVLTRAARQTREGDWIGLRPVLTPDSLAIVVEDEGAGLGAEDAAPGGAVTVPEGAERTRGLGFGLAVARALLEAHGGSLRIEALSGVGARTWLTLPRERLLAGLPAAA